MLESKYSSDYIVGGSLLDMTGRGRLCWSQGKNYDNGCSPSYNQDCPSTIIDCYACYHEPVGCAAVALGEIMWYWRWPESSEYNWDSMPSKLRNTTANDSASVLSRFLRECGEAVGMTYACTGSFATMDNIVDALINRYGYHGSHKIYKSDWGFGSSWNDIVKSEIDHKRPVLFYGDSWAFFEGHFFVVDGYQENYEGIFYHVNWGHGGNNNCFCRLDRIKEIQNGDTSYYDINNRAIVGISPTYCINQIISEVNYTKVPSGFSRNEFATDRVILPSLDNPLWVEPDGRLVIESGNEAILKDGSIYKKRFNSIGGGVTSYIDTKTGRLCTPAIDRKRQSFKLHPHTGIELIGYQIPHWEDVLEFARKAAFVEPRAHYVGWDIALCPDGLELIEGNIPPGEGIIQACDRIPKRELLVEYLK